MRCPKCGYNSFDHLDSCKKCGKDLVEFKQSYGIKSILFPGQMAVDSAADEVEFDSVADAAVSAATVGAVAAEAAVADPVSDLGGAETDTTGGGDDFGFDFMGDSVDDDDLSFDELFEEAPEDEDIEETIEGPKAEQAAAAAEEAVEGDDFSFDGADEETDLEDDFGFDPDADSTEESRDSGTGEGPERPFDLPESSPVVGAPVTVSTAQEELPFTAAVDPVDPAHSIDPIEGPAGTEDVVETYVFDDDRDPVEPLSMAESATPDGEVTVPDPDSRVPSPPAADEPPVGVAGESSEEPVDVVAVPELPLDPPVAERMDDCDVTAAEVTVAESPAAALPPSLAPAVVAGAGTSPAVFSSVIAFLCDFAIIAAVAIGFVVAAETAMSAEKGHFLPSFATLVDLSIPYFLVIFFLAFGYFTLFHFLVGQTPGKMLTGLRVETVDGEPLAFAQAFLRSVGGLLQLLPLGLGYLVALANSEHRGWNDRLAGTRVISVRGLDGM